MFPCQMQHAFPRIKGLRTEGFSRSCPEKVQFRDPLCNISVCLHMGSTYCTPKVRVIMAPGRSLSLLESVSCLTVFPCVQISCMKLNKSQHLWVWVSLGNSWRKFRKFWRRRKDDFKSHTNHRILNCINDGNWNKMFACNIFGSEGSYLMGEVWVKKAEAVIFLIPRKKEFSKLLSSGFAFYCLRDTSCPPAHSLISCWPVSATGSLAWLLFSYYQVSTISPKPPLTKAVFPPHLLLCSICHRWPLPFFVFFFFNSLLSSLGAT